MIQIQQDMPNIDGLESIINKSGEIQVEIDTNAIKLDIEKIVYKSENSLSRNDKKNMLAIKDYLEKILKKTKDNKLDMIWNIDGDILKSYPLELKHITEANIEMTDYISIKNNHLVRVDYKEVLEIIAVEMMYRDLGETFQSMEEKLSNIGITGIYPAIELLKYFDEDVLNLSKILKVSDCAYRATKNSVYEYFGNKKFKTDTYREPVEYSINHALAILTQYILANLNAYNISYKICSISDSGIYFITDTNEDIDKIIKDSAVIRAFGRRFEVKPKITVY